MLMTMTLAPLGQFDCHVLDSVCLYFVLYLESDSLLSVSLLSAFCDLMAR